MLFFQVGTVYQLIITISILLAQVMGMRNVLGNQAGWPWLLFLTVIPGVLQVSFFVCITFELSFVFLWWQLPVVINQVWT